MKMVYDEASKSHYCPACLPLMPVGRGCRKADEIWKGKDGYIHIFYPTDYEKSRFEDGKDRVYIKIVTSYHERGWFFPETVAGVIDIYSMKRER